MPELPDWVSAIPHVRGQIKAGGQGWFNRRDVEELLGVQPRRAQQIMADAGAAKDGNAYLLARDCFIKYLEDIGTEELAREARRQRRLWGHVSEMREEFIRQPPLLVEMPNREVERLQREGLDGLPPGVTVEPGRITVAGFNNSVEALQLLLSLSIAISKDRIEFDRVVGKE